MADQQQTKYFFFDIDGTLVTKLGGTVIPDYTRKALQALHAEGHFCAIATGRAQYMATQFYDRSVFEAMVSDGGNGITLGAELVSLISMSVEKCALLAQQSDEVGYPWAISTDNEPVRYTKYANFNDGFSSRFLMKDVVIPDLDIRQCHTVYKMFINCRKGEEERLPALKELHWERFQPEFIMVEPGNKETGIRKVMDYLHAPYKDVVVFGDGLNDLSMFQPEWTNIAMGNAIPQLKEKADFVTLDSASGGIAFALKHYGWIN